MDLRILSVLIDLHNAFNRPAAQGATLVLAATAGVFALNGKKLGLLLLIPTALFVGTRIGFAGRPSR